MGLIWSSLFDGARSSMTGPDEDVPLCPCFSSWYKYFLPLAPTIVRKMISKLVINTAQPITKHSTGNRFKAVCINEYRTEDPQIIPTIPTIQLPKILSHFHFDKDLFLPLGRRS
mmetsp:Transcript_28864/g.45462  ORF Transcript_28864/g.45462 Transcript_28864/m.45462 type:complete len:114 (+) Transcript_28864:2240-2581(+)